MTAATTTAATVSATCCSQRGDERVDVLRTYSHENQGLRGSSAGAAQPTEQGAWVNATAAAPIRLEGVRKVYPDGTVAVGGLTLEVPAGELVVLVGPSGCGKSTMLRMVNRLIEPTAGRILLGDEDVTHVDPVELRRRIGYVIQNVGLFPHQTVRDNVATVPRLLGWPRPRVDRAGRRAARPGRARRRPGTPAATRTSSPAGSASGSGWPGRWPPTRWCC